MPRIITWEKKLQTMPTSIRYAAEWLILKASVECDPRNPEDDRLVIYAVDDQGVELYPLVYLDKDGFEFPSPPHGWPWGFGDVLREEFRVHNGSSWARVEEVLDFPLVDGFNKMKEIKICQ